MLARFKDARPASLNADLHLPAQDKNPLRRTGAMKGAAKSNRAPAQLKAARCKHVRQHRLRIALQKRHLLFTKTGAAVGIGKQNNLGKTCHG